MTLIYERREICGKEDDTEVQYIRKKMTLRLVGRKNILRYMRRKMTKIYARREKTLRRKEDD
jgi:hypothetical protein